jgi:hypothetical protein
MIGLVTSQVMLKCFFILEIEKEINVTVILKRDIFIFGSRFLTNITFSP